MSFGFSFFTAAVTVPFVMAVLAGIVVSARGFAEGVAFVAHRVVAYGRVGSCGSSARLRESHHCGLISYSGSSAFTATP